MSKYPILVERFRGQQSMMVACERCHSRTVITPEQLENEGLYSCPAGCGGTATWAYSEGERCRNCRKMDYEQPLEGCCSRRCLLQAEYADELRARGQAAA